MSVKVALPKGRLLARTAALLQNAGWGLDGYHEKARLYRLKCAKFPSLSAKIFHERDIPIQVAIGNYDLGICGLDWVEELLAKYPSSALVKIRDLGYGHGALFVVASRWGEISTLAQVKTRPGLVRIVSEYPNLAESFALRQRLSRFSIFPVWGGAEAYPPENAELALVRGRTEAELDSYGMVVVARVLDYSAFLIANRSSWEAKELDSVVASICNGSGLLAEEDSSTETVMAPEIGHEYLKATDDIVRLALPDGHQQAALLELLDKAGIRVEDYPSAVGNRRPRINLEGVSVKVIRPQDMPLQVANGNFDLAITGRDWLLEHLYQFPSSPVKEILDLKQGKVRMVAVVSQTLPAADVYSLREFATARKEPFRVASEYVNIADKYARENHLGHYRVIPTWGATEAFLPEDADLLIENTETGQTIARHNLKIIDTLFESTACLIGHARIRSSSKKGKRIKSIIDILRAAVGG
ncbi:MAG TPA: ATP phosphoribosyltransferase [Dehalococcoidia bacterium]|nr:ATP phosphoribosyltransferase [Dehalococcoidia bacterium]